MFPRAYAVVMPALYVPLITMLLALVFRGVAFEFRWVAKPHHGKWDIAFSQAPSWLLCARDSCSAACSADSSRTGTLCRRPL